MKISPELIPHAQFHKGIWLFSLRQPGWYYFLKKKNPNHIRNKSFLDSVDEPLKELVKHLHERNIRTTPSCSGHHISERDLSRFYTELEGDQEMICGEGLYLKDVESDEVYLFREPDYRLPWTRQQFLDKLESYQPRGVLGMRLGNKRKVKTMIKSMKVDGARVTEQEGITFIFTNENAWREDGQVWKEVTEQIKTIIP